MTALRRPVNPHMVDEALIDELLDRVYADVPKLMTANPRCTTVLRNR